MSNEQVPMDYDDEQYGEEQYQDKDNMEDSA